MFFISLQYQRYQAALPGWVLQSGHYATVQAERICRRDGRINHPFLCLIIFRYLCPMTYEESLSFLERIKDTAIGAPVKGRFIQSLFIGPTDWDQMCNFMNLRIQKGDEAALLALSSQGMSLSVYGMSVTEADDDVPKWEMTNLDNWELIIGN